MNWGISQTFLLTCTTDSNTTYNHQESPTQNETKWRSLTQKPSVAEFNRSPALYSPAQEKLGCRANTKSLFSCCTHLKTPIIFIDSTFPFSFSFPLFITTKLYTEHPCRFISLIAVLQQNTEWKNIGLLSTIKIYLINKTKMLLIILNYKKKIKTNVGIDESSHW